MKREEKKPGQEQTGENKPKKKTKAVLVAAVLGIVIVILLILVLLYIFRKKEAQQEYRLMKVDEFFGRVEVTRKEKDEDVFEGMKLQSKDRITTYEDSGVELLVDSDKYIRAEENTCFSVLAKGDEKSGKITVKLEYGATLIEIENKLNKGSKFEVHTPNAITAVRGTTFQVSYDEEEEQTTVAVTQGTVEVTTDKESGVVEAGDSVTVNNQGSIAAVEKNPKEEYNGRIPLPEPLEEVGIYMSDVSAVALSEDFGVKKLKGWETGQSERGTAKYYYLGDASIYYQTLSESEYQTIQKRYATETGETKVRYLLNGDGKTVFMLGFYSVYEKKTQEARYYLQMKDGNYLCITIRDSGKESGELLDYERCVALTNEEYYDRNGKTEDIKTGEILDREYVTLFRGEVDKIQMNFLLSVVQDCYLRDNSDYLKKGLYKIYYHQDNPHVYKRTVLSNAGSDYSVEELNRLFSSVTKEEINASNIPGITRLDGGRLVYPACAVSEPGSTSVNIEKTFWDEKGRIVIQYSFDRTDGSNGMSGTRGTASALFVKNLQGEYVLDQVTMITSKEY